jgi:hypothetical protein
MPTMAFDHEAWYEPCGFEMVWAGLLETAV